MTKFFGEENFVFFYIRKGESGVIILVPLIVMELGKQKEKTGIAKVNGEFPLEIKGGTKVVKAIRSISKYGLITFSKEHRFKSSYYTFHFFKPVSVLRNLYNLGNEVLILCTTDGMNDFKSRTKDFLDYLLITSEEFKNRLDKITCILIDENVDIVSIVKEDRIQNPDARLIVPFCFDELQSGISEDDLQNRFRDFLYERDLFGIASPLNSDTLFFGKDRNNIISDLFGKYKQGEQGGLFGLRRIGKTSVLNLLRLRIEKENGAAIYFDCSQYHHNRWNEFLYQIIERIVEKYGEKTTENEIPRIKKESIPLLEEQYCENKAMKSFEKDIRQIYYSLGETRILLIFDEIESIGYTTSPTEHWKTGKDALFFWQTLRAIIQTDNQYFSFLIAGVNPQMIEPGRIQEYDNPIFGMFTPIYMDLFDYDDVKSMISNIGAHIGLKFEEQVFSKLVDDYGGHPFLTRQVCSKISTEMLKKKIPRPALVTKNSYDKNAKDYKMDMAGIIEQILGVLENYYPEEFQLLKKLALDGRASFSQEIANREKVIQHLCGYRLIEKEDGEYFIRIKSIEDYLRDKYIYDMTLDSQSDKRLRLNIRREKLEALLRDIIFHNSQIKYGKKATEKLCEILFGTGKSNSQKEQMSGKKLKDAMEELYFSQLKIIILKDWKDYQSIFGDRIKFEQFFDIVNQARNSSAHPRVVDEEDEALFNIAFQYFEKRLQEYL